jgi:hypothetical protein
VKETLFGVPAQRRELQCEYNGVIGIFWLIFGVRRYFCFPSNRYGVLMKHFLHEKIQEDGPRTTQNSILSKKKFENQRKKKLMTK